MHPLCFLTSPGSIRQRWRATSLKNQRSNKKQIDPNLKPEELERQAYIRCVRMLGTREHSAFEMRNKLSDSGFSTDTIDAVLQQLVEAGYQCDERFALLYSEQLLRKSYGPLRIKSKLGERGIDSSVSTDAISAALSESGLNWAEVATDALQRRFSMTELSLLNGAGSKAGSEADSDSIEREEMSAQQAREKRDEDQARKAKYARFLNRRGFSTTDSIKAIRLVAETVSE